MSGNITNQVSFLRTSREFPEEMHMLTVEVNKAYVDTASAVNSRTIGIFTTNRPALTGEGWFLSQGKKQQTLRQLYTVSGAGNIPHSINTKNIAGFTRIYGVVSDGTNWYPIPYVDATGATNQIGVYVDATNIVITAGGGSPPSITSGYVILEWLLL